MKSWWMTAALACGVVTHGPAAAGLGGALAGTTGVAVVAQQEADDDGEINGPGDCWDAYVEEAIEAYLEYEDCMAQQAWWDLLATIYDIRAIGAFSWWITCVGFRS
jgi:hypothetical protein